ncbi:hypothetical protein SETIT_9G201700v2 [Setaria italica]|uniref:Uncharacterized protein n=2 Tax=Setaria TaxID=4554 RepID=A0A368SIN9_SETIT|nr:hypothetical protein SETIT_9G201700v2 [Setaria italica]
MEIPAWRVLLFLACLLAAEFAGFSQGGRIVAEEDERPAYSVEQQLYKVPRTQERIGSGSPPGRMYEASARPVPQGSNPLHNR